MKTAATKQRLNDAEDFSSRIQTVSLQDLFDTQIKEIYDAELKFLKVFPEVIASCTAPGLRDIFIAHMETSKKHVKRIEEIFDRLHLKPELRECLPVFGYMEEYESLVRRTMDVTTRDMALISIVQKLEHFEIAAYDNLHTIAKILGMREIADLLQATLDEEEEMEEMVSSLAESCIVADTDVDYLAYND